MLPTSAVYNPAFAIASLVAKAHNLAVISPVVATIRPPTII